MSLIAQDKAYLPKPKYKYITNEEDARSAMSIISNYDCLAIDTEATALDPYKARMSLIQIGVPNNIFVFDVRNDTEYSSLDFRVLDPILRDKTKKKILQNAAYDMKLIKVKADYYLENIYDTMLVEQLLSLGLGFSKASLEALMFKYLGLSMTKEPRGTFINYYQKFQDFQLEYAANDVVALHLLKDIQWSYVVSESLTEVAQLEFDFVTPLCEMELNGISIDKNKWRVMMSDTELELIESMEAIQKTLSEVEQQNTLFGVCLINIDSNQQLKTALERYGLNLPDTKEATLLRFSGVPVIDALLDYRKASKLVSTYGETLLARINDVTNRLHTDFKQMVSTGRMSSSKPNLQNIPRKQKYRSCFIAREGYSLITSDMSGAELRILGNLSRDPVFVDAYATGQDLHTRTASEIYDVPYDKVEKYMRNAAKAINFGLVYGMSSMGLSRRLKITEKEAAIIIDKYFSKYKEVKKHLDISGKEAVMNRYSKSISGRKRYYNIPPFDHPDHRKIKGSIERQGKNMPIQGCVCSDTVIKGIGYISDVVNKDLEIDTGLGLDTAVGVFSGKKYVYNLKISNGICIGITEDHKIPVVRDCGSVIKKTVSELDSQDYLMIPLNVTDGIETDLSGYKYTKGHWRETFVDYKYPSKMNDKLAFVIGCLMGDGTYTKHNHIRFVCPEYQVELLHKFNSNVKELFGYTPVVKKVSKGNGYSDLFMSQVSSVVIRGFLKHIGLDYDKHNDKKIPSYFYTETVKNRGALLNGLFSTDGSFTKQSGPNFTSTSEQLTVTIQQLLLSLGINSNLKRYIEDGRKVFRLQIHKRFVGKFIEYIGFSVKDKQSKLLLSGCKTSSNDGSVVPTFIPKAIEKLIRKYDILYQSLDYKSKAHLRRFKLGSCSFNSWRHFYKMIPSCYEKTVLGRYLGFDFCKVVGKELRGVEDTYDIMCKDIHYFTANGIIVHNSNADTIKKAMTYVVDRIKDYDARLLLTVHDEIIVEARNDQRYEVAKVIERSIIDGFGFYFDLIPMQTDALIGPCWLKDKCENSKVENKCGCTEMKFIPHSKYGTKLVCSKCGKEQE